MARPTDEPKTVRLDLRFSPRLIELIDEWRRKSYDIPPRAEAIRRLIERGLMHEETYNLYSDLRGVVEQLPKDADTRKKVWNIIKRAMEINNICGVKIDLNPLSDEAEAERQREYNEDQQREWEAEQEAELEREYRSSIRNDDC